MIRTILAPTDLSPASEAAVRYACRLAAQLGASVHVMHVLEDPFKAATGVDVFMPIPSDYFTEVEQSAQEKLLACLSADQQRDAHVVMSTQFGFPPEEILKRLKEEPRIDLVVMATHGRGGVARLVMGSVADKIIRGAPCPVLTMREVPAAEAVFSMTAATEADLLSSPSPL
jgi:universal stress protein A